MWQWSSGATIFVPVSELKRYCGHNFSEIENKHYVVNVFTTWLIQLVAWHNGRTSVSGRRTFPVLRSTCSWWVTTNVGKPYVIGLPTRPTRPFILSGMIKWVVSCRLQVVPSGESYEGKRRLGRKQWQTTARYMAWFTSRHLRADCLYTGISSGPNAR